MKRIYGLLIVVMSAVSGVSGMLLQQRDRMVETIIADYKAGKQSEYDALELMSLASQIKQEVLEKVARVQQQQTEATMDDLDEALALLWVLVKGEELYVGEYSTLKQSITTIRSQKLALLKAAAGSTAEELERKRLAEAGRLAEEKRLEELQAQVVQAYKSETLDRLLDTMSLDDLRKLSTRVQGKVIEQVAMIERLQTEATLDDLDETLALTILLQRNYDDEQKYWKMNVTFRNIKEEKQRLLRAAVGPTPEEQEHLRLGAIRIQEEAQKLEADYNALKERIIDAWKQMQRPHREKISSIVNDWAGRSGLVPIELSVIWEFLDWLKPAIFARAHAIVDTQEDATIDQIDELLALLATFYQSSHKDFVEAHSLFTSLGRVRREKMQPADK